MPSRALSSAAEPSKESPAVSVVPEEIPAHQSGSGLPLLAATEQTRPVYWRNGQAIDSNRFLSDVERVRRAMPTGVPVVNLCADRYDFAVSFAAVAANGQCNLLPSSRAPEVIAALLDAHPGSVAVAGREDHNVPTRCLRLPAHDSPCPPVLPLLAPDQCVAIGHTSGSTGQPSAHPKSWSQLLASNARNMDVLVPYLGTAFHVIATVPSQHMYGIEMALLLPLGGTVSVACEMPFYAADVVAAIEAMPEPRALVTTPLHLRALLDAGLPIPALGAILSATAPLPVELARSAEECTGARVIELFGSTETCVIASRQPVRNPIWALHRDVEIHPQPDGTRVHAPWLPAEILLADLVDQPDPRHFHLRGRSADLLEIAGKRASLGDLTQRLLAIPGVVDAAVLQRDDQDARGARRLAALVEAPGLDPQAILARLRPQLDPVFLPRPLYCVDKLPRNAVGKLPRSALLAMLEELQS